MQLSNVTYVWEGVIGNTGPSTGANVFAGDGNLADLATAGDILLMANGYAERGTSGKWMSVALPNDGWSEVGHPDSNYAFTAVATDGEIAYYAGGGVHRQLSNGSWHRFLSCTRPTAHRHF